MDVSHDDDAVWRALAHPVRRALLDVLHERSRSTGELVEALAAASRHAVLQHLAVLREADLVLVEPDGRRRINHLNAVPIQRIHRRWVSRYAEPWAEGLVGLAHRVERDRVERDRVERDRVGHDRVERKPEPQEGQDVG